ncbi:MAG: RNA polymerase sigma factor [Saprospiraceae bacterium]
MNPFSASEKTDKSDKALIRATLEGDQQALANLIERHQPYIYNIAWKMVSNPQDAEDLTQETLVKIVTNLGKFNFESAFQTWAYRILRNHFLNDQKTSSKTPTHNFKEYGDALYSIPNTDLSNNDKLLKEDVIKETRLTCMSGMLLCLTKEQRLIYIIGEMFRADHTIGSEIMEISKANYRMKLSKARKDLINFMQQKCGLVDKSNPCRCHKKVTVNLEAGVIDAKNLLHNRKEYSTFRDHLVEDADYLADDSEIKYLELHREHSFKTRFKKKNFLIQILNDVNWKTRLNLN